MKKILVIYFSFCTFFFSLFASGFVDSQDGFQYLAIARRIYYDKTFELPEESFSDKKKNIYLSVKKGVDDKVFSPTGLGYTLALLPAVAIEDTLLQIADLKPLSAFPLESDWPVLLVASMTNSFFGALLAVTMYLYLKSFRLSHKTSLIFSFLTIISTNLFTYTKHTFAHMMFVSFLTLTFFLFRKHSIERKKKYIYVAGLAFGAVTLSYNQTFLFSLPPLAIYYLLLNKFNFSSKKTKKSLYDLLFFLSGILPFVLTYVWFNQIRFGGVTKTGYSTPLSVRGIVPAYVYVEGLWNILFSPGRNIFLYSPPLVIIILFWHKLKKKLTPEIVSFGLLSAIYIFFIGTLLGGWDFLVWHGESSWGPRYLTPLIPFLMILVVHIYKSLSRLARKFIFIPLVVFGIYVQLLGMILPYQIKFSGLKREFYLNDWEFTMYTYTNMIPRFNPVFAMTKTLYRKIGNLDSLFDHGKYNLRLYDGFDVPFHLGDTSWRAILGPSTILFDQNNNNRIENIQLRIQNKAIENNSKYKADIEIKMNNKKVDIKNQLIEPNQYQDITITDIPRNLKPENNIMEINPNFIGTSSASLKNKQVIFLESLSINDSLQNIETLDFPFVSPISERLFGAKYKYWGGIEKDNWSVWHMHSAVYNDTFDLWWLRPYHFWDLPGNLFYTLFIINLLGVVYFGTKLIKSEVNYKK